ncbi:MAG: type III-B CRISPR module RAMP protein Cmr6 [Methanothrix sp.]|nr:type III-B CRISPR module RAMP protein Cmr6 [Methanothrix sp.]
MNLPLYRCSDPKLGPKGNSGLWYDKFCYKWDGDWRKGLGDGGKSDWIDTVLKDDQGNRLLQGDEALLEEMAERRRALISASGGKSLIFRTKGPFVTGLGRSHPVENGFGWHHSLGVPYLPGSSIKGMVRSWAHNWEEMDIKEIGRIFGPDNSSSVGSVVFLDALPLRPVKLKKEIMTPHYGPYYSGSEPPADWHSPIPIPFLAVDAEQDFLFGLVPRIGGTEDCKKVEAWLLETLQCIGAGAKTAVGYGRFELFEPPDPGREWLEELAKSEGGTPEEFAKKSPKVLEERWEKIEDNSLKKDVLNEIKKIYQEIDWWDGGGGGSAKKAIKHYKSWEAGH